jgi:hypothetical protein
MESPIKYFASMDDFRQLGKVAHKLENIIAITVAAVICGCENWYEIEDYGRPKEPWLKTFLDLPRVCHGMILTAVFLCRWTQRH